MLRCRQALPTRVLEEKNRKTYGGDEKRFSGCKSNPQMDFQFALFGGKLWSILNLPLHVVSRRSAKAASAILCARQVEDALSYTKRETVGKLMNFVFKNTPNNNAQMKRKSIFMRLLRLDRLDGGGPSNGGKHDDPTSILGRMSIR